MSWQAFVRYGRSFFTGFIVGLPVYVTVTDFGFCIARVDGISMQPSLNPVANESDVVFLNRWAVRDFEKVNRGDIVSLISPTEPDVKLIKRVVGLEGDIIRTLGYKKPYVLVPKGHCWIEGDHRGRSLDSNTFGPVSLGLVNGLATCVVWPPKRWTKLERTLQDDRIPMKKYLNYYQNEKSSSEKGKIIDGIIDKCPIPLQEHIVSKNEGTQNVEQCITSDVTISTEENMA